MAVILHMRHDTRASEPRRHEPSSPNPMRYDSEAESIERHLTEGAPDMCWQVLRSLDQARESKRVENGIFRIVVRETPGSKRVFIFDVSRETAMDMFERRIGLHEMVMRRAGAALGLQE